MRSITYCVVPQGLYPKLQNPLRRFYRDDPSIEVIVERRARERRRSSERRSAVRNGGPPSSDRRKIRSSDGRRVAERRAVLVPIDPLPVPRRVEDAATGVTFVERIDPSTEYRNDVEADRLIARAQSGDASAAAELYLLYFDRIYGYMRVTLSDTHEAEDASQDVFLQVLKALPEYEIRRGQPFRTWLFRLVRNHALNTCRNRRHCEVEDPVLIDRHRDQRPSAEPGDLLALDWLSDTDLLIFIERLSLAQRQVLALNYMMGLRTEEIAEVLDRTPESVRQLQHRALRFLEDRLTAMGRRARRTSGEEMLGLLKRAWVIRERRFALARPLNPFGR